MEPGEVFGFLGPNGAGKSTTIKLLMGLIFPSRGMASLFGRNVSSPEARQRVGYLPENPAFYDYLTAEEYLAFVGKQFGMPQDRLETRIEEVLQLLELRDARKRTIRGYSKGMVQRLGLAQVLVHDPDLYILDEPMSGLDPLGRALVKEVILDLRRKGKTVFFSTHITSDVETVCDRVGIILKGELKTIERVETILSRGISGYRVRSRGGDGSVDEDLVSVELLSTTLDGLKESGRELDLVEPVRKDLEEFFLEIVKGGQS
jgi:ABC-2 type transport system ATP-binding protein